MKKYILFTILISFSFIKTGAQEQVPPDSTWMKAELEEVVIKASKDNVTHKTIPASVSVISSDTIEENEIRTLNEITVLYPISLCLIMVPSLLPLFI